MLDRELWKPPLIIAHRGSRQLWPENTMLAFQNAVSIGVEHIETDVHVSGDGVVHCLHDHTLDRTTNGSGPIGRSTSSEISGLDAGYHHGSEGSFRDQGIGVPTFEEMAATFPGVRIVVDLKEDAVVEPFASLALALGVGERLIVGSFDDHRIRRFRELTSGSIATSTGFRESRLWLIASRLGRGFPGEASALQLPLQLRGLRVVDRRLVDAAHGRGLQVHVWTINDQARMADLLEIGVDGVVTDRPDLGLGVVAALAP